MADCKGAQLYFGTWAIWTEPFNNLLAQVNGMDIDAVFALDPGEPAAVKMVEGVAVLEVSGPLTKHASSFRSIFGGASYIETKQALRDLSANDEVQGVLLQIDSPGGHVAGLHDLHDAIRAFAAEKPIHAYAEDLAASAAYDIATATDRITANRSAIVGSLGTVTVLVDSSERAQRIGVKAVPVASGRIKAAGFEDGVSDEYLAETQRLVDSLAEQFRNDVAQGRGMTDAQARQLFTGQVWVGAEAVELGLVDSIGSLEDAIAGVRDAAQAETSRRQSSADKGRIMTQSDTSQPAASVPATVEQLEGAWPEDPAFVLDCLKNARTMDESKAARLDVVEAHLAAARKEIAQRDETIDALETKLADAEHRASQGVGANAVGDGDATPDENDNAPDATQAYHELMDKFRADGLSHRQAASKIAGEHPEILEAYEDAANVNRNPHR